MSLPGTSHILNGAVRRVLLARCKASVSAAATVSSSGSHRNRTPQNTNNNGNGTASSSPSWTAANRSRRANNTGKSAQPKSLEEIVQPVTVRAAVGISQENIGQQITGRSISKEEIATVLNAFAKREQVRAVAAEHGLTDNLFMSAAKDFKRYCLESDPLHADIHVIIADVLTNTVSVDELFGLFLAHAQRIYPHLECIDDLQMISDLREPHAWFAEARLMQRKIFFHAGPTNSGKTYNALQRFMTAKSGVYCGPLKMLASEVFNKTNAEGISCDLVTGEERRFAIDDENPSDHVSCTVEMVNCTTARYEVAVIDEIQMMRDRQRGWAWTRALLGVCADEVHVCGEPAAISLVRQLLVSCGEDVSSTHYERMTPLQVASEPLGDYSNVQSGDCVVCFSRQKIYETCKLLESKGHEVAVVYGALPPGTKLAQAARFNDPDDACKVLVATDAIGMGLNLNINRVVFDSLMKMSNDNRMRLLTAAHAKQIGGRAGRYGTQYDAGGKVTTLKAADLPVLHSLFQENVQEDQSAGLHPTADQLEMFSFHLPHATMTNLIDIFQTISSLDKKLYFMCDLDDFRSKAELVEHVPMPLKSMYQFCLAPINVRNSFVASRYLRFARRFSQGQPLTAEWLIAQLGGWPQPTADSLARLQNMESMFDVMDCYLWLAMRFVVGALLLV